MKDIKLTDRLYAAAEKISAPVIGFYKKCSKSMKRIARNPRCAGFLRFLRKCGAQTAAVIVMFFLLAAVILYNKGYYDISFIQRPQTESEHQSGETDSATPDSKPDADTAVTDNAESTDAPAAQDTGMSYSEFDAILYDAGTLYSEGKSIVTAEFDASLHVIAKITPQESYQNVFSFGSETVKSVILETGWYNGLERKTVSQETARPALDTYMGFIIRDNGESIDLLNSSGEIIKNDIGRYGKAYAWDRKGRAMFFNRGNYIAVSAGGGLYSADFDRDEDTCGLFGAQPSYVGGDTLGYTRYSEDATVIVKIDKHDTDIDWIRIDMYTEDNMPQEISAIIRDMESGEPLLDDHGDEYRYEERVVTVWGYKDRYDNITVEADYLRLFDYGENKLAAAVGIDGRLRFIDNHGNVVIDVSDNIYNLARFDHYPVYDGFYAAEYDLPSETLGMYYFDHGLVRVRRKYIDRYEDERVLSDYDILINEEGEEFVLPGSYNLVAYSDGVALVEKNGKYGYYDYRGTWIAPPVYTYAQPFSQGLGVIGYGDGKKCMVDTSGNIVLPLVFDYISSASEGVITVYESFAGWSIYNIAG